MNPYMSPIPWAAQRWCCPDRQAAQDRHDWNTSTATRSPTPTSQRSAARVPTASITPTVSWPGTKANPAGSVPVNCSWSVPQRPHASTRRIAPSSPTSGMANPCRTRCRGASSTIAEARPAAVVVVGEDGDEIELPLAHRLLQPGTVLGHQEAIVEELAGQG